MKFYIVTDDGYTGVCFKTKEEARKYIEGLGNIKSRFKVATVYIPIKQSKEEEGEKCL